MNKFIRYFNQNRRKIYSVLTFIIFGFILLQFFNYRAANNLDNVKNNNFVQQNQTIGKDNINTNSALTGNTGNKGSSNYTKETDLIEQFLQYCNQGNIVEAYNMLSNECKENMFPEQKYFVSNYYNSNFDTSKSYNIQRWTGSIYKVDLRENILHTGNISGQSKQDFVTIVYEDGGYKLNINNYISRKILNIEKNIDNISINIIQKDTYMDYETYIIEIKNNTNKNIYLDNLDNSSTIYIVDENGVKHTAYSHEITKEQLHIYSYSKKEIQIKFSNNYVSGREFKQIVFENVILDDTKNESEKISINLK